MTLLIRCNDINLNHLNNVRFKEKLQDDEHMTLAITDTKDKNS